MRPAMPLALLWILLSVAGAPPGSATGLHGRVKVCAAYDFVNRKCKRWKFINHTEGKKNHEQNTCL